jgi:hypothetical protein
MTNEEKIEDYEKKSHELYLKLSMELDRKRTQLDYLDDNYGRICLNYVGTGKLGVKNVGTMGIEEIIDVNKLKEISEMAGQKWIEEGRPVIHNPGMNDRYPCGLHRWIRDYLVKGILEQPRNCLDEETYHKILELPVEELYQYFHEKAIKYYEDHPYVACIAR